MTEREELDALANTDLLTPHERTLWRQLRASDQAHTETRRQLTEERDAWKELAHAYRALEAWRRDTPQGSVPGTLLDRLLEAEDRLGLE